ncbi:MAG: hypothetical protein J1F68_00220 [Clostridiales bacterium]|nr:hypothetical protein [Clostridiales bacterium]
MQCDHCGGKDDGERTFTCQACGEKKTEVISATGQVPPAENEPTTPDKSEGSSTKGNNNFNYWWLIIPIIVILIVVIAIIIARTKEKQNKK